LFEVHPERIQSSESFLINDPTVDSTLAVVASAATAFLSFPVKAPTVDPTLTATVSAATESSNSTLFLLVLHPHSQDTFARIPLLPLSRSARRVVQVLVTRDTKDSASFEFHCQRNDAKVEESDLTF
jgi:hypothetical protein